MLLIAREALTNADRHARASEVSLELEYRADGLTLTVRDNGIGLPPDWEARQPRDGRYGMCGMRERARRMGGEYRFERGPDGARSTLTLPLVAAVAAPRHEVVAPRAAVSP
ncbi:hypothetical protein FUT87_27700 [Mitsuaria sp. TWR114]|uniref:ATP-binding protein n=1 Tax=Mitsuaria sp. TWR114 TaxID=2601731 RepID=UPI0011BEFA1C|nr:ATP-binding protein [Mitsuaria sp. TWR114]TXD65054.1 hypothetical protein FUT87_27700 [Mitsuaria sp. TWR114]